MKTKIFELFGFQVEINEAVTKEWYDNAKEWSCDCGDCRYFVALTKKRELPSVVLEVLDQFGISLGSLLRKLPMSAKCLQKITGFCISSVIVSQEIY